MHEFYGDGGWQCDERRATDHDVTTYDVVAYGTATCNVAKFLFLFFSSYLTLHPVLRIFEVEAFAQKKIKKNKIK
jgi:hypothetical protein